MPDKSKGRSKESSRDRERRHKQSKDRGKNRDGHRRTEPDRERRHKQSRDRDEHRRAEPGHARRQEKELPPPTVSTGAYPLQPLAGHEASQQPYPPQTYPPPQTYGSPYPPFQPYASEQQFVNNVLATTSAQVVTNQGVPSTYLIFNVAMLFFFWPVALYGIFTSISCSNAIASGDLVEARRLSAKAKCIGYWALGLGIAGIAIGIVSGVVSNILYAASVANAFNYRK